MVCTGNICRSPMAVGLLRDKLEHRGVDARVASAGLLTAGEPASPHGVTAMARRGIDIASHRSQYLSRSLIDGADLVIGMEPRHVREVAVLHDRAFPKAFTLPELARRARVIGPRAGGEPLESWIARAGAGRRPADLLAQRPEDTVVDPIGRSKRYYENTAAEIDDLLRIVVEHLYP